MWKIFARVCANKKKKVGTDMELSQTDCQKNALLELVWGDSEMDRGKNAESSSYYYLKWKTFMCRFVFRVNNRVARYVLLLSLEPERCNAMFGRHASGLCEKINNLEVLQVFFWHTSSSFYTNVCVKCNKLKEFLQELLPKSTEKTSWHG